MFEHGNFWGAYGRIVFWRAISATGARIIAAVAAIAFAAAAFAVSPMASAAAAAETVDDLFLYFAHEWTYEQRTDNIDKGGETQRDISERGGESLRKIIIAAEPRFGHLGEYWELRALYDVAEPRLTPYEKSAYVLQDEKGEPYVEFYVNMDCLRKAAAAVPPRAPAIAYIGQKEQEAAYALTNDDAPPDVEMEIRIPPSADLIYADALAEAAKADPDNGWYPLMRGSQLMHLGEWDDAIADFQRAGACGEYFTGYLFPFDYANKVYSGVSPLSESLTGLTAYEKGMFLFTFGTKMTYPKSNYIRIKDTYLEVSVGVAMGTNSAEIYTAMHRAACTMGGSKGSSALDGIVAMGLVNSCAGAMKKHLPQSRENELYWLAVRAETETIKTGIRYGVVNLHTNYPAFFELLVQIGEHGALPEDSEFKEIADYALSIKRDFMAGEHGDLKETDIGAYAWPVSLIEFHGEGYIGGEAFVNQKIMRPAFERLKKLDYSNPGEWYEKWLVEKKFVREEEVAD